MKYSIALCSLLLTTLVGCGGSNGDDDDSIPNANSQAVVQDFSDISGFWGADLYFSDLDENEENNEGLVQFDEAIVHISKTGEVKTYGFTAETDCFELVSTETLEALGNMQYLESSNESEESVEVSYIPSEGMLYYQKTFDEDEDEESEDQLEAYERVDASKFEPACEE